MRFTKIRARIAAKVMRSRFFIFMNEDGSTIFFDGVEPNTLEDQISLRSQMVELEQYKKDITKLIARHKRAMSQLD